MVPDMAGAEAARRNTYNNYFDQTGTNAYSRFITQQRGERDLGQQRRQFGRQLPRMTASFGARGLSGPGVKSGVMGRAMQDFVGDNVRNMGYAQQDLTQGLQLHDFQQQMLDRNLQDSLVDIDTQTARNIAETASNIQMIMPMLRGG
jgi:hypothetical protein